MTHRNARSLHAIIGALVGDAASLGFHWLYDQELIRQFGSPHPEFHQPNRTEYHDKGYFAHGSKQVGDLTHYGAQLVAMLDALVQTGHYDEARYIRSFREWFDFGGKWQGYTDKPTKQTLLNIHELEAKELRVTLCGADDTQNPALSKLPPLVAFHSDDDKLAKLVDSAVRVTNNNDTAVMYAQAVAVMIQMALQGAAPKACVMAAQTVSPKIANDIQRAEAMSDRSATSVAESVGMHCGLDASFVVICHLLMNSESYETTMRENIYCGGDSSGRAIPLGAILGASYYDTPMSIPNHWMDQTALPRRLLQCL